jgi:hypothetical protein
MALTTLQRDVCRLLADSRIASGESYVAGGAALNELLSAPRVSRDLDLFHDTQAALAATWDSDRRLLEAGGYALRILRERPTFVEAEATRGGESVLLQWAQDSAYRFFPLVESEVFGLTLHPFDLATNKVLALVGRLEARDWVDVIQATERIQPLGYLAWAACGKDLGFSPSSILEHAARSARYSSAEVSGLAFEGDAPDGSTLAARWRSQLEEGREVIDRLPPEESGRCVLGPGGTLYQGSPVALGGDLAAGRLVFHPGRVRGAFPTVHGQEQGGLT